MKFLNNMYPNEFYLITAESAAVNKKVKTNLH